MGKVTTFNFPTFLHAWEGLNEFLANNQTEIVKRKIGGTYGTEMVIYNSVINVELAKIPDDFDFGKNLGYKNKKWSKLINNYINLDYLELVKSEVIAREKTKGKSYNHTVHFDNSHGSGKDCLISLTFHRRVDEEDPTIIFTTRASECTKRMVFDFCLLQKMAEYVYGKEKRVKAILFIPMMYINVESFLIYVGYKGGLDKTLLKDDKLKDHTLFQKRIINRWNEFTTKDVMEIKYRVHRRAAEQIQGLAKAPPLLAKDLRLIKELPDNRLSKKLNKSLKG